MNAKQKFVIAILALIFGSGATIFSYNSITNTNISGDTTITNNLDIDIKELKELCHQDVVPEKYKSACKVLDLLP